MRIHRRHLLAAACNVLMLVGLAAGVATGQAPPAPSKGDGLLRSELSLGGRTAGLS
jgi:hypothetical protein